MKRIPVSWIWQGYRYAFFQSLNPFRRSTAAKFGASSGILILFSLALGLFSFWECIYLLPMIVSMCSGELLQIAPASVFYLLPVSAQQRKDYFRSLNRLQILVSIGTALLWCSIFSFLVKTPLYSLLLMVFCVGLGSSLRSLYGSDRNPKDQIWRYSGLFFGITVQIILPLLALSSPDLTWTLGIIAAVTLFIGLPLGWKGRQISESIWTDCAAYQKN